MLNKSNQFLQTQLPETNEEIEEFYDDFLSVKDWPAHVGESDSDVPSVNGIHGEDNNGTIATLYSNLM